MPAGRPSYVAFAAGYQHTASVHIERLTPSLEQAVSSFHATTWVGIRILARANNGSGTTYAGWYAVTSTAGQLPDFTAWRILLSRSHLRQGTDDTPPSLSTCLAGS
jgi:hypothetical protein